METIEEVEELIYDLMHPSVRWLLHNDVNDFIDLEKVTYLINTLKEDPTGSVAAVSRMAALSKMAYGRVKEAYEDIKLQRDRLFNQKMEEALSKDSPASKVLQKQTISACEKWVKNLDTYQLLEEQAKLLESKKDRIWQLVEHLQFQGEQMNALLGIYSELPVTGEVLSPGEVNEIVAKFRHQVSK